MDIRPRLAFIIFLIVIFILFVGNQVWFNSLQKTKTKKIQRNFFYNIRFVENGRNYHICDKISKFQVENEQNDNSISNFNNVYKHLQTINKLSCANHRTDGGILKSKIVAWTTGCVEAIFPAKRRLVQYLHNLCERQAQANIYCKLTSGANSSHLLSNPSFTSEHEVDFRDHCVESHTKQALHTTVHTHTHVASSHRGIIFTGKIKHFKNIYQSILALRMVHTLLPVEIWVNSFAMNTCVEVFMKTIQTREMQLRASFSSIGSGNNNLKGGLYNVQCRQFSDDIVSFASKFYVLLYTEFDEVLFMDSDNIAVRDIAEVFESDGYKSTGATLWPDVWSSVCPEDGKIQLSGRVGRPDFVLFAANFTDLKWRPTREYSQETEAGQMVLDLRRHKGLINLGRRLYEDKAFFRRIFNGDKDIFRFMFLLTHTPFHYVDKVPGYSVDDRGRRDCLVHYHELRSHTQQQHNQQRQHHQNRHSKSGSSIFGDNVMNKTEISSHKQSVPHNNDLTKAVVLTPLFFHQLKTRDPTAFKRYIRNLPSRDHDSAVCLPIGMQYDVVSAEDMVQKEWFVEDERVVIRSRGQYSDLYVLETPKEGVALQEFASKLFETVDNKWNTSVLRYKIEWYIFLENYIWYLPTLYTIVLFVVIVVILYKLLVHLYKK